MRWVVRGLLAVLVLVVLALGVVYGGSQYVMQRAHAVPMAALAIPVDSASVAEGARLARVASCRDCHGQQGQGKVLFEAPMVGRAAPPALARVAAGLSDADLVRAIRQGVHKDSSTLFIMPSAALGHLADEDVARIVAWIRTLRPGAADSRADTRFGPIGRALILAGKIPPAATAAVLSQPRRPAERGRYFVDIACSGCHQLHQPRMMEDGTTQVPALAPMAAAYDPVRFRQLLRTGVGMGRRDLGLMSMVARESLSSLSDAEIEQVHAYLTAEASRAPTQ